jgi:D-amino-acid oxidase
MTRETLVVGSGVSGLTTAIRLLEAGHRVRILTRELPFRAVSGVAPAIWHPYRAFPEEKVVPWAKRTLEVLEELADDPGTGVSTVTMLELFEEPPEPEPAWIGLVRTRRKATPGELPADAGVSYGAGYVGEIPRIETPVYLPWLLGRFGALGGFLEQRPEGITDLAEVVGPDRLVVNCTGLGARELTGDREAFPIRGQIVRVSQTGLTSAVAAEEGPLSLAYVIPRDRDVILGGTAEPGEWDLTPDPEVTEEIREKTTRLEPRIGDARVLEVKVGLRPGRTTVRVERAELPPVDGRPGGTVIHNYGHGGAGYTLSWGCAEDVVALAGN